MLEPSLPFFEKVVTWRGRRFGITHDMVMENDQPYLERWILWFGFTVRLHCFLKGDDDRAYHDHPWWFVTFPLRDYLEATPDSAERRVRRWRPHFRRAKHRHIVRLADARPVWTLILTGPKCKEWGFWEQDTFIHHSEWLADSRSVVGD